MSTHLLDPLTTSRTAHEILVVDDNPATRYSTARVLRAAGFRTREVGTGGEALQVAPTGVSAVILDVHLPDVDGFEVCSRLRRQSATALLPVIHLSASRVLDDDKVRGLDAGADAYMTHPAEPALLVATLQALIRARTAEEELRRSSAGFRAIYNEAPSGIALIDADGRFTDANPAMLALLRRPESEVVGTRLVDHAAPELETAIASHLAATASDVWRGEFALLTRDGRPVHLAWSLSAGVRPGAILGIATDISERTALSRQREELLEREQAARRTAERLSRSKDEFIAVLSHELRTPLNAIMGWVSVLQTRATPENLARGLPAIQRNAEAQTRLIADILEVSRMRVGKLRLEIQPADVLEIVHASIAALAQPLEAKSLRVEVHARGDIGVIRADPARVQQIVWNLLTNAIKFSNANAAIEVEVTRGEDEVTLSVADQGKGIAADFLPFVFDRFAQSDLPSNRQYGGLGLGLSIVKQLIELHGGSVAAFSEGVGKGARFVVHFPLEPVLREDDAQVSQWAKADLDAGGSGLLAGMNVLVVEDDPDARELLTLVLREQGALVGEAADCDAALVQMQQRLPDALVSDIGLPGRDGYWLIDEVRRRFDDAEHRLPAIAVTAFARPKDREAALAAGFDAHCGKPINAQELVSLLRSLV